MKEDILKNIKLFDERSQSDRLAPDEVRETYEQANRLLKSNDHTPIYALIESRTPPGFH